jgi:hypothetical protein
MKTLQLNVDTLRVTTFEVASATAESLAALATQRSIGTRCFTGCQETV